MTIVTSEPRPTPALDASWTSGAPPAAGTVLAVKTRYRQSDAQCVVSWVTDDRFELVFTEPQWAVTPGQSVVLYQGEACLGGGVSEVATMSSVDRSTAALDRMIAAE